MTMPGAVTDAVVETLDIFPTLRELAEVSMPVCSGTIVSAVL